MSRASSTPVWSSNLLIRSTSYWLTLIMRLSSLTARLSRFMAKHRLLFAEDKKTPAKSWLCSDRHRDNSWFHLEFAVRDDVNGFLRFFRHPFRPLAHCLGGDAQCLRRGFYRAEICDYLMFFHAYPPIVRPIVTILTLKKQASLLFAGI